MNPAVGERWRHLPSGEWGCLIAVNAATRRVRIRFADGRTTSEVPYAHIEPDPPPPVAVVTLPEPVREIPSGTRMIQVGPRVRVGMGIPSAEEFGAPGLK